MDVEPDDWFYDAVCITVKARIIKGVDETHFNPGGTLTRAEWVTMLYRTAGSPAVTTTSSFQDVPADAYYADAFAWAESQGIVNGVGGGMGAPELTINREQMVTMLYRYHGAQPVAHDMSDFADMGDVSAYAVDAFVWAIANGYIIGMTPTTLMPGGIANRAQAVTVLARYLTDI